MKKAQAVAEGVQKKLPLLKFKATSGSLKLLKLDLLIRLLSQKEGKYIYLFHWTMLARVSGCDLKLTDDCLDDWRADGYHWYQYGTKMLPRSAPLVKKHHFACVMASKELVGFNN